MTSHRRDLLATRAAQSLGAGAALAPFVPLLNASGQEMVFPKRLLLFFSPDGTVVRRPQRQVDRLEAAGDGDGVHAALDPLAARAVQVEDRHPLGPEDERGRRRRRSTRSAWRGCGRARRCTSRPATRTSTAATASAPAGAAARPIDQIIAAAQRRRTPRTSAPPTDAMQETPYRTLELGAQCAEPHSMHRMIYKGDNQPIHPETNPLAAFDRLFPTGSTTTPPPSATAAATARKRAQLDALMSQVEKLRGARRRRRRCRRSRRTWAACARCRRASTRRRRRSAARRPRPRRRRRWSATRTARRSAPTRPR